MPAFLARLAAFVRKLRAIAQVPEPNPLDHAFSALDVGKLHRLTSDAKAPCIDDQTWSELLLHEYSEQLSGQVSIFGRQVLHRRLRMGLDDGETAALGQRLRAMTGDPAGLQALHRDCQSLRHADTEVAELIFTEPAHPVPAWAGRAWLLAALLAATVAAAAFTPVAWLGTGVVLYLLMSTQLAYADRVQRWESEMKSVQMLLRVCSILAARSGPSLAPFAAIGERAGVLNRRLSRSMMARATPGASIYSDWFLLSNVEHYFRCVRFVAAEREFLRECYTMCATLEADIALARHLLASPQTCWAVRASARRIMLDDAVHPLMTGAAPLSLGLDGKGAFISGQNGIGKSTALRTTGINVIAARAFGFCYARAAELPALPVFASMQNDDSLPGGESSYMSELRRARELLAVAQGPHGAIFIIDEIFRGTNHLESVSAAAAVLDQLAGRGLVLVSSHNLVLASLLAHQLVPLRVTAPGDDRSKLLIEPGVLERTNGLALLSRGGFGADVEANAARVFDWLSVHLAQPGRGAHVLAGSSAA
jgi:hypothetical protein